MNRVVAAIAVAASLLMASGCSSSPEAAGPESATVPQEVAAPARDDGADVSDGSGQYETEVDADVTIVDVRPSDSDAEYAMAVIKVKNRGEECPVGAVTALFYDEQGTFYTEGVNHFMELGKGDTVTINVEAIRTGTAKRAEVVEVSCQ